MKQFIAIFCAVMFCIFFSSCSTNKTKEEKIILLETGSFFSDFSVEDDEVKLYCHIVVYNQSGENMRVLFQGDFEEDMRGGLITDQYLTAYDADSQSVSQFLLHPGRNILDLVFLGKYGGSNIKQNRLLPPIEIIQVND